jgi:hypothetical protein
MLSQEEEDSPHHPCLMPTNLGSSKNVLINVFRYLGKKKRGAWKNNNNKEQLVEKRMRMDSLLFHTKVLQHQNPVMELNWVTPKT